MKKILFFMQHAESILWFKEELLIELSKRFSRIAVYVPEAYKVKPKFDSRIEFKEINVKRRSINPLSDILLFVKYVKIIKNEKPDLILTNAIKPNIYGNLAARIFKVPVISNVPGVGTVFQNRKGPLFPIVLFLFRKAFAKTHKIFFENQENKDLYIELNLAPSESAVVINGSGVNVDKFYPQKVEKRADDFTFLLIGRVMIDKGINEYVQAAKLLSKKYNNVKFKLLGMVEDKILLKRVTDSGCVEYIGIKQDVRNDIAYSDCVVLPSYHEGMANTLLEAAAMAKPLIASNISGCKEIVEDQRNGFLCEARDVKTLVGSMEKMLSLSIEEREIMGLYGRKKMVNEFNRKDVIRAYINAIYEVIPQADSFMERPQ